MIYSSTKAMYHVMYRLYIFLLCVYSHKASKMKAQDLCQRSNGLPFKAEGGLDFQFVCWQGSVVYFIADNT